MNYPYSISPNLQGAMIQAMQAIMSGGPLPQNCFIVTVPFHQVQQMMPHLLMNYAAGGGGMMFPQQPLYHGQAYQPQIGPYQAIQPSNALVPYSNYYPQHYAPNYQYPVVPYNNYNKKLKQKSRRGKKDPSVPHSNIYESSSFDSHMDKLSWSRLFGHHRRRRHSKQQNQASLSYDQKSNKRQAHSADTLTSSSANSSTTTSDETIRRVNVSTKQPSGSSSSKQQTKSSLPFKYSSEFIPGLAKQQQKSDKKEAKIKSDDVFVVKKTEQSQPSSQK